MLVPHFIDVEHFRGHRPYDLIAQEKFEKYGINVKSGNSAYLINRGNIKRLIKESPNMVPSYLFLDDEGSYLFTLKEIYPSVKNLQYQKIPFRKIAHTRLKTKDGCCPECDSSNIIKAGMRLLRDGRRQRYQCKDCGHTFVPTTEDSSTTLEVLKIIYKNPRLKPKDIHSKRTLSLYRSVYSILTHMTKGGLVERQDDSSYIITDLGKNELQRVESKARDEE